jgi:hypothetical protein
VFTPSFYEWRDPSRSTVSLSLLALAWLVIILTPTFLLVKSTFLVAGIIFFGLFPISSRYSQYRLLVSPMTFLFWKIPTHGWSLLALLHLNLALFLVDTGSKFQPNGTSRVSK